MNSLLNPTNPYQVHIIALLLDSTIGSYMAFFQKSSCVRQKKVNSILWYYRWLKNMIYSFYCVVDVFKMDMEMGFPQP
jgi:hypothetical protein